MGIFSLTTLSTMAEKAVKPYWQDVQVVEVNKEYPRTSFMTYNNRADALSGKFERSKYYRLLNGTWKFYFVDSYGEFYQFNLSSCIRQQNSLTAQFVSF
ncbi:hypothetical protein, partial [Bacteroides ovatus]|uniref:hypothetical protein n=1 Tax=Bacteroides ovatus TaxID=28116 RepID=UPI001E363171